MDRHPNDLTTDAEIDAALETAKEFIGQPRVVAAEYLGGRADLIVLRLSTGGRLAIPREQVGPNQAVKRSQFRVANSTGFSGVSVG
jgi:hypothetical protein